MKRMKRNKPRLAQRRVEAAERQADTAALSPKARLARLDARLGQGVGAKKEREKLARAIVIERARAEVNNIVELAEKANAAKEVFGVETVKEEQKQGKKKSKRGKKAKVD